MNQTMTFLSFLAASGLLSACGTAADEAPGESPIAPAGAVSDDATGESLRGTLDASADKETPKSTETTGAVRQALTGPQPATWESKITRPLPWVVSDSGIPVCRQGGVQDVTYSLQPGKEWQGKCRIQWGAGEPGVIESAYNYGILVDDASYHWKTITRSLATNDNYVDGGWTNSSMTNRMAICEALEPAPNGQWHPGKFYTPSGLPARCAFEYADRHDYVEARTGNVRILVKCGITGGNLC